MHDVVLSRDKRVKLGLWVFNHFDCMLLSFKLLENVSLDIDIPWSVKYGFLVAISICY